MAAHLHAQGRSGLPAPEIDVSQQDVRPQLLRTLQSLLGRTEATDHNSVWDTCHEGTHEEVAVERFVLDDDNTHRFHGAHYDDVASHPDYRASTVVSTRRPS